MKKMNNISNSQCVYIKTFYIRKLRLFKEMLSFVTNFSQIEIEKFLYTLYICKTKMERNKLCALVTTT